MIFLEELKNIVDNNTVANVDLTKTKDIESVPGHETKIVDTTKLMMDVQRLANAMAQEIIGKNRVMIAGEKKDLNYMRRIQDENFLRNNQRKITKEIIYGK